MAQFSSQRRYCNRQKWSVMLPTISSAGTIVHSMLLTEFSVTGCYQLPPRVLMSKISTQQSTWMEMMESVSTTASTKERGNKKSCRWLGYAFLLSFLQFWTRVPGNSFREPEFHSFCAGMVLDIPAIPIVWYVPGTRIPFLHIPTKILFPPKVKITSPLALN